MDNSSQSTPLAAVERATLEARRRTGDESISTDVRAGRFQVVRAYPMADGGSHVLPVTEPGTVAEAVAALDSLTAIPPPLEAVCNALGWQGGTIHQVTQRIKRLRQEHAQMLAALDRIARAPCPESREFVAWAKETASAATADAVQP